MLFAFVYSLLRLLLDVADLRLRVRDPEAELLLLRRQLRVVRRQVKRPQLDVADRAIRAALSHGVSRAAWIGMLVPPETVLGWHRQLVRRKWAAFGRRRGPGRPGLDSELQKLILEMAKDNPKWGCVRIRGELLKLGHVISATAIRKLLRRNRIGPAPLRSRLSWKAFFASTSFGDRPHRLPERGHRAVEASLRSLIYGAGHQEGDLVRGHRSATRVLGDPAGEEPVLGTRPDRSRRPVPGPRSRRQVRRQLRRCLSGGRCRSDQDADCSTQGQCPHRAPDWFDPARVPGLDSDPEPSPSRARSGRVVLALQLGPSPPGSWVADPDRTLRSGTDHRTANVH